MSKNIEMLVALSTLERVTLRVAVGWGQTATGKERELFASVTLRKPIVDDTKDAALFARIARHDKDAALTVLASMVSVSLRLPKPEEGKLRLNLSQVMPGDFAAVAFAHIGGHTIPATVKPERADMAFARMGIVETETPKPERKGKGKGKTETAADAVPIVTESNGTV